MEEIEEILMSELKQMHNKDIEKLNPNENFNIKKSISDTTYMLAELCLSEETKNYLGLIRLIGNQPIFAGGMAQEIFANSKKLVSELYAKFDNEALLNEDYAKTLNLKEQELAENYAKINLEDFDEEHIMDPFALKYKEIQSLSGMIIKDSQKFKVNRLEPNKGYEIKPGQSIKATLTMRTKEIHKVIFEQELVGEFADKTLDDCFEGAYFDGNWFKKAPINKYGNNWLVENMKLAKEASKFIQKEPTNIVYQPKE